MGAGEHAEKDLAWFLAEWRQQAHAIRDAVERSLGLLERVEQRTGEHLQQQFAALHSELSRLADAVQRWNERAGGLPGELRRVEEAARTARSALERLAVLDATQAASLQAVGEELRGLRSELERLAARWDSLPEEEREHAFAGAGRRERASASEPMLEIVRMHLELLRTLVERGVSPAPSRMPVPEAEQGTPTAASGPALAGASMSGNDEGGSAPLERLRTELRAVAASLEHQLGDLREEHQRRAQFWERRLDEMQHAVDQLASLDHGRRLFFAVGLGFVVVLAGVAGGLAWYRSQSPPTPAQVRQLERARGGGNEEKESEYQRLLSEVDVAVAQGAWERAEKLLAQASRLRPESRESALLLSLARASRASRAVETGFEGSSRAGATGTLACAVRDGRLCCSTGADGEQCVTWPVASAPVVETVIPTPTPRSRRRAVRTPAEPPPLSDDDF